MQKDNPVILIQNNDIDRAIVILREKTQYRSIFNMYKVPRKNMKIRQRRRNRRLRDASLKNQEAPKEK